MAQGLCPIALTPSPCPAEDGLHPTYFPTSSLCLLTFLQFFPINCLFLNMALSLESLYYLHVGNPSFPPLPPAFSSPSFLLSLHILSMYLSFYLYMFMHMQVQACTCMSVYRQYMCMWRSMVKFRCHFSDTILFFFSFFLLFSLFWGGWGRESGVFHWSGAYQSGVAG